MTVYVDDIDIPYKGMIMCHMIADTEKELHKMANKIGLKRDWYQGDHYDLSQSKKQLALENGAKEISWRDIESVERGEYNG